MADKEFELKTLTSLAELTIEGEVRDLGDLTEDAWEYGAPPPHDVYQLKCFLSKDGWKQGLQNSKDPGSVFLQANLECRIIHDNEDYNGIPVFIRVNTKTWRGKTISTMEGMIAKWGFAEAYKKQVAKNGGKITPKFIAKVFEAALKSEPTLHAELDWRGSYSYIPKGSKDGEEKWENVYNHYWEFPKNDDGGRQHIVSVAGKDGLPKEIRAQLNVVKIWGKGEEVPKPGTLKTPDNAVVSPVLATPVRAVATPVVAPVAEVVIAKPQQVAPTVASPVAAGGEVDDMELMLAE